MAKETLSPKHKAALKLASQIIKANAMEATLEDVALLPAFVLYDWLQSCGWDYIDEKWSYEGAV